MKKLLAILCAAALVFSAVTLSACVRLSVDSTPKEEYFSPSDATPSAEQDFEPTEPETSEEEPETSEEEPEVTHPQGSAGSQQSGETSEEQTTQSSEEQTTQSGDSSAGAQQSDEEQTSSSSSSKDNEYTPWIL